MVETTDKQEPSSRRAKCQSWSIWETSNPSSSKKHKQESNEDSMSEGILRWTRLLAAKCSWETLRMSICRCYRSEMIINSPLIEPGFSKQAELWQCGTGVDQQASACINMTARNSVLRLVLCLSLSLETNSGYVHISSGPSSSSYHDCGFSKMRSHLSITLAVQAVHQVSSQTCASTALRAQDP